MESSEARGEPSPDGDAHGRAALLLVESLIHGLGARSALSATEAVEIMEIALEAQDATTLDSSNPTPSMRKASVLISALVRSLSTDLPQETAAAAEPDAV